MLAGTDHIRWSGGAPSRLASPPTVRGTDRLFSVNPHIICDLLIDPFSKELYFVWVRSSDTTHSLLL